MLVQALGDGLVEVTENLHRQLRVDTRAADQVVERVGQRKPDARIAESILAYDHKTTARKTSQSVPAVPIELVESLRTARHVDCRDVQTVCVCVCVEAKSDL